MSNINFFLVVCGFFFGMFLQCLWERDWTGAGIAGTTALMAYVAA